MSEIYHRYMRGESIPSNDLGTNAGLRLYGEIIHDDWRNDKAIMQMALDQEVYIQKVHPVEFLTPEQEHLSRKNEIKNII